MNANRFLWTVPNIPQNVSRMYNKFSILVIEKIFVIVVSYRRTISLRIWLQHISPVSFGFVTIFHLPTFKLGLKVGIFSFSVLMIIITYFPLHSYFIYYVNWFNILTENLNIVNALFLLI